MKKLLVFVGCLAAVIFQSCTGCKEIGPSVNLTPEKTGSYDSVYTLTAAEIASLTADVHLPLVEEFTGQDCNNCPSAHATLESINGINVIGLYLYSIPQAIPPTGAIYDFRDSVATQVGNTIYGGIGTLPSGGIDRLRGVSDTNKIEINRTAWTGNINTRKAVPAPLNITLTSSFNVATQTAKIIATVTYVQPVSVKQNLTVVITEDGMVDLQEFPDTVHSDYRFTNVFRDMVSSAPSGSPVLDSVSTKPKGMVLKRTFNYKLKTTSPAIKPDSCHVVAFVSNNNGVDQQVVQSAQTKLK